MELIIKNLTKNFDQKQVLNNINFTFQKGKIYGLLGRNGAGKTTFFNCLNEDISRDSGDFMIVENETNRTLKEEDMGYVQSIPAVPEFLTGREFIKFFIDINKDTLTEVKEIDSYFDFLKIDIADRDKLMKDYSHGMKNKMQMLIYIISSPNILLLDEPLTSFDVVVADEMKNMLRDIKQDHIIIFSTHILELATDLCDEIVILHQGTLSLVPKDDLNTQEYKNKIVDCLRSDENDTNIT